MRIDMHDQQHISAGITNTHAWPVLSHTGCGCDCMCVPVCAYLFAIVSLSGNRFKRLAFATVISVASRLCQVSLKL